ncbi:hypothetical protein [Parapedomonas caeni]
MNPLLMAQGMTPEAGPAVSVDERLTELLQIVQRLTLLVETENRLLETERPAAIQPLLEEKGRLSAQLAKGLAALKADGAGLKASDTSLRRALSEALAGFQELVMLNGRIVLRLKSVSEGILGAIAAEASKGKRPAPTYGANATVAPVGRTPVAAPISVNAVI